MELVTSPSVIPREAGLVFTLLKEEHLSADTEVGVQLFPASTINLSEPRHQQLPPPGKPLLLLGTNFLEQEFCKFF